MKNNSANKIIFFNNWHNGDIHVSREFVRDIVKKTPEYEHEYLHRNSDRILLDLENISVNIIPERHPNEPKGQHYRFLKQEGDIIFINTWYNCGESTLAEYGISLMTLYENFRKVYSELNIELEDISYYIPDVNFKKYKVDDVNNFMANHQDKIKVYICNGDVKSNQAEPDYNFNNLITSIAQAHQDTLFFISNPTTIKLPNVIQNSTIIGLNCNEFCENAYISTFCDIVFGRNSGCHTFCFLKDNVTSTKPQTHICNVLSERWSLEHYYKGLWGINKKIIDTYDSQYNTTILDKEITSIKNNIK